MDTVDDATCYININIPMKLFVFDTNSVTIRNGRQTVRISVLHKVLGSEEDSNEVSEPVGPLVHDNISKFVRRCNSKTTNLDITF